MDCTVRDPLLRTGIDVVLEVRAFQSMCGVGFVRYQPGHHVNSPRVENDDSLEGIRERK